MKHSVDVLVVGAGTAGLASALQLAEKFNVGIICKSNLGEGSSLYAQGGIAAVLDQCDSLDSHVSDTLIAGAGLCDKESVRFTVENARSCIDWLIEKGVSFTRSYEGGDDSQEYHLVKEGGHSHRRILHADDATGKAVQYTLSDLVVQHENITIFSHYNVLDVIKRDNRCVGVYALNVKRGEVEVFASKATILATGGASRAYMYSTNPVVSSGDGIAIAYRAGCRVANMEFNQFHPTSLFHEKGGSFLLSEALRGEGAILHLPNGDRFMDRFDKRGELAPRDIVARAIDFEIKRLGITHVYLDISHKSKDFIVRHFPTIYKKLLDLGIDMTKESVPVVPAAHYTCGGVMVDNNARTDVESLYAAGEVTYTGLHGANRMASNSLLECLVYAQAAADDILLSHEDTPIFSNLPEWNESLVSDSHEEVFILHNWRELRWILWNYLGIVRSDKRLDRAQRRIDILKKEVFEYYSDFRLTGDLLELRNLILIGDLMVQSARLRKESRGLHYTLDYPKSNDDCISPTILDPKNNT
jgi:L-aspartate oxidase